MMSVDATKMQGKDDVDAEVVTFARFFELLVDQSSPVMAVFAILWRCSRVCPCNRVPERLKLTTHLKPVSKLPLSLMIETSSRIKEMCAPMSKNQITSSI